MQIPSQLITPAQPPPAPRTYWVLENVLLAGAYPGKLDPEEHRRRIAALYGAGMRTFINLQEEEEVNPVGKPFVRYDDALRSLATPAGERIYHMRFPIPDGRIASLDRMRSILDAIDLSLAANRPVYLHCFGGIGRTGTTVCCWLLRHGLATPHNVLSLLKQLRQADQERATWRAPENAEQDGFVLGWKD